MNIKNLNVFRRLDKMDMDHIHTQVLLKKALADIDNLKKIVEFQTQWLTSLQSTVAPKPRTTKRKPYRTETVREKARVYARAHYAKKKAEREAAAKAAA
jgi:hypothetical protein